MKTLSYYFEQTFLESGTANVIQVLKTCEGFAQNGVKVTLYAPTRNGVTREDIRRLYGMDFDISIRRIVRIPHLKTILNAFSMFYYLLKDDNPVIFTRNFCFAFLASFLDKVVILEAHQHSFDKAYYTLMFPPILKRIAPKDNLALVVISEHLKKKLNEKGIFAPMLVCHDGYDDRERQADGGACIERGPYKATAMYAGSLKKIKGLEHIEYLADNNKDVRFCLIGDESDRADKDTVERLKAHENVIFMGKIRHAEVYRHLCSADVLLLLPTSEGVYNDVTSPLKMFEYMDAGKAILATGMPSLKEILRDGHNALLAADDKEEVDRQFKRLVEDGGLRSRLGENAREDVKQFSWKKRACRIKDYVSSRCQGGTRGGHVHCCPDYGRHGRDYKHP